MFGKPLGVQLLAELWECTDSIDDPSKVEKVMLAAAKAAGAEVIGSMFHEFEPYGVSGVVVISESHMAIHSWPELSYAAIDIFLCGDDVDPWVALEYITKELGVEEMNATEINRGIKFPKGK